MLTTRIIACLDTNNGKTVKGVGFKKVKEVGDPLSMATEYYKQGADEIVILDIGATVEKRKTAVKMVSSISENIFIPICVGGGIKNTKDIRVLLENGADKVSICTAALFNPNLITEAALNFGSQCVVVSIDAKRMNGEWFAMFNGGRKNSGKKVIEWAQQTEDLGAGEILLNSLDTDGTNSGYDLELINKISKTVNIPIIASSGAGKPEHLLEAIKAGADAVLIASMLHSGAYSINQIKNYLKKKGVIVRC